MKWKTSSSSVAVLCVSSTKGEERAKELWVSRMRSEFDSVSPRSYPPYQPLISKVYSPCLHVPLAESPQQIP